MQFSTTLRNEWGDLLRSKCYTLKIRTGAKPINCSAADTGTVIAELVFPVDAFPATSGGVLTLTGVLQDTAANATGDALHARVYDGSGVCHMQGSASMLGGGGDFILENNSIAINQHILTNLFKITLPGA